MLGAGTAHAWYFPEHAELTRLGLRDEAPRFVQAALQKVVLDGRAAGLHLCAGVLTGLNAGADDDCVPYGALAALAADHSNTVVDLARALAGPAPRAWPARDEPLGTLLTIAAADVWSAFQDNAPTEVVRVWTTEALQLFPEQVSAANSLAPRDYVRILDARLFALDPSYIDRAKVAKTHFHDPTSSVQATVWRAASGDVDNALAQALVHHVRSLGLAVLSRSSYEHDPSVRVARRKEALLEHAFALHFIEDGLAAGHVATDPAIAAPERRTQRHDYFNRQGLAVTRALERERCSATKSSSMSPPARLGPCWIAHGDGFATAADVLYVGEAAARLQAAFAVALEGEPMTLEAELAGPSCAAPAAGGAVGQDCEPVRLARLLDPVQDLLGCSTDLRSWARDAIHRFELALEELAKSRRALPVTDADSPAGRPGAIAQEFVKTPIQSSLTCSPADAPDVETLWLPLVAAWPAPQADLTSLEGSDSFGHGINVQVLASLAVSDSAPFKDATLNAWGGVGAGLSYSAEGVFPRRHTRAFAELNVGLAQGVRIAGSGERFPSLAVLELRAPITTLLLYGISTTWRTAGPLKLVGSDITIGILGGRGYFGLERDQARFTGWVVEVIDFSLGAEEVPRAAARSGLIDPEARIRLGVRSVDAAQALPGFFHGALVIAFEVNSGLFTPLY